MLLVLLRPGVLQHHPQHVLARQPTEVDDLCEEIFKEEQLGEVLGLPPNPAVGRLEQEERVGERGLVKQPLF